MRLIAKLALTLLLVAGMLECLLCGMGILQITFSAQGASILPGWLQLSAQPETLVQGSYWGVLVVSISALTCTLLDRRHTVPRQEKPLEQLVATPLRTEDCIQHAYLDALTRRWTGQL